MFASPPLSITRGCGGASEDGPLAAAAPAEPGAAGGSDRSSWQTEQVRTDDQRSRPPLQGLIGDIDAVAVRQLPIGDYQRIGLSLDQLLRLTSFGSGIDGVSGAAQADRQQFAKLTLVLNEEDALSAIRARPCLRASHESPFKGLSKCGLLAVAAVAIIRCGMSLRIWGR
jgi:hypothetical protein